MEPDEGRIVRLPNGQPAPQATQYTYVPAPQRRVFVRKPPAPIDLDFLLSAFGSRSKSQNVNKPSPHPRAPPPPPAASTAPAPEPPPPPPMEKPKEDPPPIMPLIYPFQVPAFPIPLQPEQLQRLQQYPGYIQMQPTERMPLTWMPPQGQLAIGAALQPGYLAQQGLLQPPPPPPSLPPPPPPEPEKLEPKPDKPDVQAYHVCAACGKIRSSSYQYHHQISPGEQPAPGFCRKCVKEVTSSDEESSEDSSRGSTQKPFKGNRSDRKKKRKEKKKGGGKCRGKEGGTTAENDGQRGNKQRTRSKPEKSDSAKSERLEGSGTDVGRSIEIRITHAPKEESKPHKRSMERRDLLRRIAELDDKRPEPWTLQEERLNAGAESELELDSHWRGRSRILPPDDAYHSEYLISRYRASKESRMPMRSPRSISRSSSPSYERLSSKNTGRSDIRFRPRLERDERLSRQFERSRSPYPKPYRHGFTDAESSVGQKVDEQERELAHPSGRGLPPSQGTPYPSRQGYSDRPLGTFSGHIHHRYRYHDDSEEDNPHLLRRRPDWRGSLQGLDREEEELQRKVSFESLRAESGHHAPRVQFVRDIRRHQSPSREPPAERQRGRGVQKSAKRGDETDDEVSPAGPEKNRRRAYSQDPPTLAQPLDPRVPSPPPAPRLPPPVLAWTSLSRPPIDSSYQEERELAGMMRRTRLASRSPYGRRFRSRSASTRAPPSGGAEGEDFVGIDEEGMARGRRMARRSPSRERGRERERYWIDDDERDWDGSKNHALIAGASAGLVSRFCIAPLDVVKIRLQLQVHSLRLPSGTAASFNEPRYRGMLPTIRTILKTEGFTALWKGNLPAEALYLTYGAVQFSTYRALKDILQKQAIIPQIPEATSSFFAGSVAGGVATATTYPLDLLRTRFAAQGAEKVYGSLLISIKDIVQHEGPRGFFQGVGAGIAQIIPYMGLFFCCYESLRRPMQYLKLPYGSGDAAAGALASLIAKTGVFPLDLIRKRLQVQGPTREKYVYRNIPVYKGIGKTFRDIVRIEGWRGLYRGLTVSLFKAAPASAITMWTFERSSRLLDIIEDSSSSD
ncbi:MAG: mitochondrial thiamine pyrophosphate transporter [Trizodia sp. TS-e1964]|nr:MAG: mitochondrial thiamine pyrophosphate transporter [Trizodia sp. TS-e1964]